MAKSTRRYLNMRGNKYWFKRDIPSAIRYMFDGKSAYLVNLETGDIRVAMARRDEIEKETSELYKGGRSGVPAIEAKDTIRELAEFWAAELRENRKDPHAWASKINANRAPADPLALPEPMDFIREDAKRIAHESGGAAKAEFLDIVHGRVSVDHHSDAYLKEAKLAPKTAQERKNLIKRFSDWAQQERLRLPDITRAAAGKYMSTVIAPLHRSTAKKHLGSVKLYWDFLIIRGLVKGPNPWERQAMPNRGRRVERASEAPERPFTAEEMKTLLYSAFPDGLTKDHSQQIHDAMRISALSGMRLAEIITLWCEECVLDERGVGYFDIKQGKTSAAARRVPMHPDLVEIVQRRLKDKAPTSWLFSELEKAKSPSDKFGKRFARYRAKLGVKDTREGQRRSLVNFHSFRRWFVTQAEQAGQPESIISSVVGHEEGRKSITLRVYSGGPSDAQKRACVEAVAMPPKLGC